MDGRTSSIELASHRRVSQGALSCMYALKTRTPGFLRSHDLEEDVELSTATGGISDDCSSSKLHSYL